jgi:hypothetical protein
MLSAILQSLRRRYNERRMFLLIKSWGCGFWSDMNHVLGCLLLAEITGRIPVTYWGRNSLYRDGTGADAFGLYFEPISPFTIRDLETCDAHTFFPAKWSADSLRRENNAKWEGVDSRLTGSFYLNRPETVVVSDFYIHLPDLIPLIPVSHAWHGKPYGEVFRLLAQKYLRLVPHILASIDEFHRERMSGSQPIIAVHVRVTDKFYEADEAPSLQAYFDIIDGDAPGWRIFLLTDQTQCVEAFRSRYGSRVIFTDARRSGNQTPVHLERGADRARLGTDIVIDTYLALRCQKFVGLGMSNPSCIVSVFKDWGDRGCTLLGPSLLEINFERRIGRG